MLSVGSLCSGIGGLELGVEIALGAETRWQSEIDPAACSVLDRWWPAVPNLGDLRAVAWDDVEPVDLLVAGFPCQPVSTAGRRKVTDDDRWLWLAIADAVRLLRPGRVLLENVPGLLAPWRDGHGEWNPAPIEEVVGDLAALGYVGRWRCLRSSDVGAPHRRERVFIAAADARGPGAGRDGRRPAEPGRGLVLADGAPADPDGDWEQQPTRQVGQERRWAAHCGDAATRWGRYEPAIRRWEAHHGPAPAPTDDRGRLSPAFVEWMMGYPPGWCSWLPRTAALRCLGNSVQPQVAELAARVLLA